MSLTSACLRTVTVVASLIVLTAAGAVQAQSSMPSVVHQDGRHALIVDGAPFTILGAQVNNSSN